MGAVKGIRTTSMSTFETKRLPPLPDAIAPDGSDVRVLVRSSGGSLAHFELAAGHTSIAVAHRTVEEIWFIVSGHGEIWRRDGSRENVEPLHAGVSLTIPLGTHFQFRSLGPEPLTIVGLTMPPWPGDDEAFEVAGRWAPTVNPHRG
jgi:mannose-6-phosphate isomerase-like protein (cupin superfamily)